MAEKITVRTTFRPDLDVEVDATEAVDLRRQGLLVEDKAKKAPEGRTAGAKGEKA